MKPAAAIFTATLAFAALTKPASGQLFLEMSTGRDYIQSGPYLFDFRTGDLFIGLQDGSVTLSPCADHPSPVPVPPNIFCPLGTNGFIANGDIDGDGIRDGLFFWSIAEVIPAILVEPFLPELCQLNSAPFSDLPRPLGPFSDRGAVIFFDIFTASVLQYDVTVYEFVRTYPAGRGGWTQMRDEVVYGQYIFTFPQLNRPAVRVPISVAYRQIPEAVGNNPNPAGAREGFRFTSGTWGSDGAYLMDPRITTLVTWEGNTPLNTFPAADSLRLAIFNTDEDTILFPPSQTYLTVPSPLDTEYLLPPFFFNIGDEALFQLRFDRNLGTTSVAFDTSVRLFHFNVRFVDSYAGFRNVTFPTGASALQITSNADFDGDGVDNLTEFARQTDPTDPLDFPADFVAVENMDGTISYSVDKRPFGAVVYRFEVSENGGPYRLVGNNDATWDITVDDDTVLTITSKGPEDPADFDARLRATQVVLR